jgi:hypothetical protein
VIDPSIIDAKIAEARDRDNVVTHKLLQEVARLPVVAQGNDGVRTFSLDLLSAQLRPGRWTDTGMGGGAFQAAPEPGSYAYQLYSAICFVIDARTELKLLELIASPIFYAALMRSAGEVEGP